MTEPWMRCDANAQDTILKINFSFFYRVEFIKRYGNDINCVAYNEFIEEIHELK